MSKRIAVIGGGAGRARRRPLPATGLRADAVREGVPPGRQRLHLHGARRAGGRHRRRRLRPRRLRALLPAARRAGHRHPPLGGRVHERPRSRQPAGHLRDAEPAGTPRPALPDAAALAAAALLGALARAGRGAEDPAGGRVRRPHRARGPAPPAAHRRRRGDDLPLRALPPLLDERRGSAGGAGAVLLREDRGPRRRDVAEGGLLGAHPPGRDEELRVRPGAGLRGADRASTRASGPCSATTTGSASVLRRRRGQPSTR